MRGRTGWEEGSGGDVFNVWGLCQRAMNELDFSRGVGWKFRLTAQDNGVCLGGPAKCPMSSVIMAESACVTYRYPPSTALVDVRAWSSEAESSDADDRRL